MRKQMKKALVSQIALSLIVALGGVQANAQPSNTDPESRALEGGAPLKVSEHPSVEACWSEWLRSEGLQEGKNERGDHFVLISHKTNAVGVDPGSKNWISNREAVFSQTELEGRRALAEFMRSMIRSDRSAAIQVFGGDNAPPSLKPAVDQLSLAEKTRVLADKAVDAEIKKYDPKWAGDASARASKVATTQMLLDQNVESSTDLFASGAFTVAQCEGPSTGDQGKYSILVGLIWSPELQRVAETIWNPALKLPPAQGGVPLAKQFEGFAAENPDWLAYTEGVRVFTNEKGERVVVGFGVAPKTSLASADQARARLLAQAAIQRFLGENITARSADAERFARQDYSDESVASFDYSTYESTIKAVSKDLALSGATEVTSWRGEHPWSKAGMQVVAVAWSQASANDAKAVSDAMRAAEQRMQRQGLVAKQPDTPKQPGAVPPKAGAATGAKRGARSPTGNL
jgi:hypothetical protein